jgi:acyl-coenzyme A synthetase/AMP-(fatty) acid ligase
MDLFSSGEWVQKELLAGEPGNRCVHIGDTVTRGELNNLVDRQQRLLESRGLQPGGTLTIQLPPSLEYIATLLAGWRVGAQVSLLDHRLVRAEVDRAVERLAPQIVVTAQSVSSASMAGYSRVTAEATPRRAMGRPAATPHALVQLSSGSTGPSKVIGRTVPDLIAELGRYQALKEYPGQGTRIVVLSSIAHVLGLIGGLLHSLHAGAELVFPDRLTADGIRAAVTAGSEPTTLLGVPFYAELLATGGSPLPQLTRMVVAGELTRPWVPGVFTGRYGVPLGTMYGMTELGVIATDLSGRNAPAVAPAPGMSLRVADGELLVRMATAPYLGPVDEGRWADGWLHTRDAATIDPATGLVTILGRLDSQVSIGGLKVDLTEVEQTLCALPEVDSAVVTYDKVIEGYLVLRAGSAISDVESGLAEQLAPHKRPRQLFVLTALPRTATGKVTRSRAALQTAVDASASVAP